MIQSGADRLSSNAIFPNPVKSFPNPVLLCQISLPTVNNHMKTIAAQLRALKPYQTDPEFIERLAQSYDIAYEPFQTWMELDQDHSLQAAYELGYQAAGFPRIK